MLNLKSKSEKNGEQKVHGSDQSMKLGVSINIKTWENILMIFPSRVVIVLQLTKAKVKQKSVFIMRKLWNSFKKLNHYVPFLDEIVYVQVFREFMIVV